MHIPLKEEYIKKIHSNKPLCMKQIQDKYYSGCKNSSQYSGKDTDIYFYNFANIKSKESIISYLEISDLNYVLLSKYLYESQKNKRYMLYNIKTKSFILKKINEDDYIITNVIKNPEKYRYECTTKSLKKMNILLRWKNGNGIAFPAFQINYLKN